MKSNPRIVAACLAAGTVIMLAACGSPAEDSGPSSVTISGAVTAAWDPFNGAGVFGLASEAVYDTLFMQAGGSLDPQPWLAQSFEISEDGMTVRVELRDDVDFIDGTHMDAAGVEDYLTALFASDGYVFKNEAVNIFSTGVVATGEYSLEFTTNRPVDNLTWFAVFSLTPIVSPAVIDDPTAFAEGPVGSGPYLIDEVVPDVSITYERNPQYWNPDAYPYDEVTIHAYADAVAALNAISTDQLDVAQVDVALAQQAETEGLSVFRAAGLVGSLFVSDHEGQILPALGDVRVRRAMNMVFDRDAILANTNHGFGEASSQPFAPGQDEHVEGGDDRYLYDVETAKRLMAEAGYSDGFEVIIPTFQGGGIYGTTNLEPIVQTALAEIGIRVTYESYGGDASEYVSQTWAAKKYPLLLINMPRFNWVAGLETIWMGYNNPVLEEMVHRFQFGKHSDRPAVAAEIGEFILDEAWYVPISWPATTFVAVPEVDVRVEFGAQDSGTQFWVPKLWQYAPAE